MTEAAQLVRWAWQDPPGRVHQALERVRSLALAASGAELREIQDAGTMLSRLASAITPELSVPADGIAAQILDLAGWRDAYKHEARGPHGEWTRGGLDATGRALAMRAAKNNKLAADRKARLDAARQVMAEQQAVQSVAAQVLTPPSAGSKAADVLTEAQAEAALKAIPLLPGESEAAHLKPEPGESPRENLLHEQLLHEHITPIMEARAEAVFEKAKAEVRAAEQRITAAGEGEEAHKAKLKAATEGAIAVAGGLLAYIGTRLGVPDLAAIAASVGPILIQVLIEFWKKLLCPRLRRTASSRLT